MFEDSGSCDGIGLIIDDAFISESATHLQLADQSVGDRNIGSRSIDSLLQADKIAVKFLLRGFFIIDQKKPGTAITAFEYEFISHQVDKDQCADQGGSDGDAACDHAKFRDEYFCNAEVDEYGCQGRGAQGRI